MDMIMSLFSGQNFWKVAFFLVLLNVLTLFIASRLLMPKGDKQGKKDGKT